QSCNAIGTANVARPPQIKPDTNASPPSTSHWWEGKTYPRGLTKNSGERTTPSRIFTKNSSERTTPSRIIVRRVVNFVTSSVDQYGAVMAPSNVGLARLKMGHQTR